MSWWIELDPFAYTHGFIYIYIVFNREEKCGRIWMKPKMRRRQKRKK